MNRKVLLGTILAIVIIGGIYYLGKTPRGMESDIGMPQDTTANMPGTTGPAPNVQAAPQSAGQTGSQTSGGASSAEIDAAVSAISAGDQAEATQANSENGTESATQLNSSMDSQNVYAE